MGRSDMSQVNFRKVEEDGKKLVYAFWGDHANIVRRLTTGKESGRMAPEDGNPDREYQNAGWGIFAAYERDGSRPERGYRASG
jgi:hypothetical protein